MHRKISGTHYEFKVSARTAKGPRSFRGIRPCTCEREAKQIDAEIAADLKLRAQRSLKFKTVEFILDWYQEKFPAADWGDRFPVAKTWTGHLAVDKTLMHELEQVIQRYEGTPTFFKRLPAASSVNKIIGIPRAAIHQAFLAGIIDEDYLAAFPNRPENNEREVYLSPAQVTEVLSHMTATFKPVAEFAYWCASRQSELLKVRNSEDIDFDRQVIILRDEYVKGRRGQKKGRELPIPDHMMDYFREKKSAWAFYVQGSFRQIKRRQVAQDWHRACEDAGIEAHFHDLRGSRATDLVDQGWNMKDVMKLMGHRSAKMFLRYQKARRQADLFASIKKCSFSTTNYDTNRPIKAAMAG
jgi:integrase